MGTRSDVQSIKPISKYQFAVFRIVFGIYLVVHFALLVPYGSEMFSRDGMLPSAELNFTHGVLPNPLEHWDCPEVVIGFLVVMLLLAVSYTLGTFRRTSALLLWYGWACLFNRNNLISNPSIPYVGLLLLFSVILPPGEPLSLRRRKVVQEWFFPAGIFWCAWILLAVGYTFSGCSKLMSPSWLDGTAMVHIANNPLARPGIFRNIFLSLPEWSTKLITWGALSLEVLFAPLCLHRKTRMVAWSLMGAMHLGILLMIDFADLSFGMVMFHLFTFDPGWMPARRDIKGQNLVLYDGVCGLCDRTVQVLLDEDTERILRFAPLQGSTAQQVIARHAQLDAELRSMVFVTDFNTPREKIYLRSEGVLRIADVLGGFWRIVSWLRIIPMPIRNGVYNWIARNRYQWFGQFAACKLPSGNTATRFLP